MKDSLINADCNGQDIKPTPSPWRVEKTRYGFRVVADFVCENLATSLIVSSNGSSGRPTAIEDKTLPVEVARVSNKANAEIIAKAPTIQAENEELRNILKSILEMLEDMTTDQFSLGRDKPIREKIRAKLGEKDQSDDKKNTRITDDHIGPVIDSGSGDKSPGS